MPSFTGLTVTLRNKYEKCKYEKCKYELIRQSKSLKTSFEIMVYNITCEGVYFLCCSSLNITIGRTLWMSALYV